MAYCVAFLRAINVGGRFLKMAALAEHCRALGLADVQTYINSGNVIFHAGHKSPSTWAAALQAGLPAHLGFVSEAFVRTAEQVHALADKGAALGSRVGGGGEVNVIFLSQPLTPEQSTAVMTLVSDIDSFDCTGTELFWLCRTRQSDSKFSNAVLERKLGLRCTLRRASMLQGLSQQLRKLPP